MLSRLDTAKVVYSDSSKLITMRAMSLVTEELCNAENLDKLIKLEHHGVDINEGLT